MSTLLDALQHQLDGEVLRQVSAQIGADPRETRQAVSAALPLLVSALGRNAAHPTGAASLAGALSRDHDGGLLNDLLGYVVRGGNAKDGAGILGHIFGQKRDNIEEGLSRSTGLDKRTAGKLLLILAPIVMAQLGKAKRENDLGPSDISDVLGRERQQADSALGGFARILDLDGDGSVTDDLIGLGSKILGGFGRR